MADAINRIVPSSVAVDRGSWQEKERQKRQNNKPRPVDQPLDVASEEGSNGSAAPVPGGNKKDKGKNLDISV
jgi:hypothetical protein